MLIELDNSKTAPLYQQLVEQITRDIALGKLPPGYQLPTVRELANESGISQGTIKHAYDILEQSGLIRKTRGSGTFVYSAKVELGSTKAKAMQVIDEMLDKVQKLSFSLNDIRIFLDLKLREREEQVQHVMVAAVDCTPEALAVMCGQIAELPHTEVITYLLDEILKSPAHFDPAVDLVVTTSTHYKDLIGKMIPGSQPCRLVMTIATNTALELAALPSETRLGVIAASERYSQLMLRACEVYGKLTNPVKLAFFGNRNTIHEQIKQCDRLLLPSNYELFASQEDAALIRSCEKNYRPIFYHYQVERGSLLFLEEQIHRIFKSNQG
ncbi:MAG: GntR family transcriptional regulator [Treponema sp.]|jgi:DNA-binding transcriptional regulator YhcF (GntR family)|nr:GntR family transcriptional regulator [Treponema sp.]